MIVVDASIAAKWLLPESDSAAAQRLLDGPDALLAPDLIRVEVAAAITRAARLHRMAWPDAARLCQAWFDAVDNGAVVTSSDDQDLPAAVTIALQLAHPLPDCLYLALATRLGVTLLTTDPKLIERAASSFPNVRLLADDRG